MAERTVEDRLRAEYALLVPDMRRVAQQLEAEIRYLLLPLLRDLESYERLEVRSRIKECESAVNALRRRQEGGTFDRERPATDYTLTRLPDLAGVRVLVFPRGRLRQADELLRQAFPAWASDPVPGGDEGAEPLALKYRGRHGAAETVGAEYQIVPMLTGLFWEVEHSAIYKPARELQVATGLKSMKEHGAKVLAALDAFDRAFEQLVREQRGAAAGAGYAERGGQQQAGGGSGASADAPPENPGSAENAEADGPSV